MGVFGGIFVNAGIAPFILCTWTIVLGASMFRRQNMIKAICSATVFTIGLSLVRYHSSDANLDVSMLLGLLAPAFLELGVVFLINKLFFMTEDAELQVTQHSCRTPHNDPDNMLLIVIRLSVWRQRWRWPNARLE